MNWLICGTVPDDNFPLCLGTWMVEKEMLVPVSSFDGSGPIPCVPVRRGTPALSASAILAANALSSSPPALLLAGDQGSGKGSARLYDFLAEWLIKDESANIKGLTFHYMFPSVDGHNRILMALDERKGTRPRLIADAGFMYAAKMSGFAARYDVFTPDAGELAFLADEKAPHPFYTRGFFLADGQDVPALARMAFDHEDSAKILLVKGKTDLIVEHGEVTASVSKPCIPFMEPIGGTGDIVTGLLTAFASAGIPLFQACVRAAQAARFAGEAADPTPATSVSQIMPFIKEGVIRTNA
ncbi:MAG: sugar kinase [Mailhella sp.]|nr:sugar kinase [Mailhella sp.]